MPNCWTNPDIIAGLYDHQFNRVQKESEAETGILVEELV